MFLDTRVLLLIQRSQEVYTDNTSTSHWTRSRARCIQFPGSTPISVGPVSSCLARGPLFLPGLPSALPCKCRHQVTRTSIRVFPIYFSLITVSFNGVIILASGNAIKHSINQATHNATSFSGFRRVIFQKVSRQICVRKLCLTTTSFLLPVSRWIAHRTMHSRVSNG